MKYQIMETENSNIPEPLRSFLTTLSLEGTYAGETIIFDLLPKRRTTTDMKDFMGWLMSVMTVAETSEVKRYFHLKPDSKGMLVYFSVPSKWFEAVDIHPLW